MANASIRMSSTVSGKVRRARRAIGLCATTALVAFASPAFAQSLDVPAGTTYTLSSGNESYTAATGTGTINLLANRLSLGSDGSSSTFAGNITDASPLTYQGMWALTAGPAWPTSDRVYSGTEAAAFLFGGAASDYRISTVSNQTSDINDSAWYDRIYVGTIIAVDDLHQDVGAPGYNTRGDYSAYIRDNGNGTMINYAFTGGQSLGGGLTKEGAGTLTLTGDNSYSGITMISGGTLAGTTRSISGGSIVVNGALTYNQNFSGTVAQNISGSGRVSVSGLGAGETLTFAGNLTNDGINLTDGSRIALTGTSTTSGNGVIVTGANATVSVADGASLTSNSGPAIASVAANTTVNNLGAIAGYNGNPVGVGLYAGGTINNGSASDSTASIIGGNSGSNNGGTVTLNNYGLVRGDRFNGIDGDALTINNFATGQIVGAGGFGGTAGFGVVGNAVTLVNSGQIVGRYAGVEGTTSLNLTNSGLIGSGYLSGTTFSYSNGFDGVRAINGGTVNNLAGGQILGTVTGIYNQGALLTITNAGAVNGLQYGVFARAPIAVTNDAGGTISGATHGIYATGGISTVTNSGTITASNANTGSVAVRLDSANAVIINNDGGSISGGRGVFLASSGSVTNAGSISGTANGGDGIQANGVLTIDNRAGGSIAGARIGVYGNGGLVLTNSGTISGAQFGAVYTSGSTNTITNNAGGMITATGTANALNLRGSTTVDNSGSLSAVGNAVYLNNGGSLINRLGGTITATNGEGVGLFGGVAGANRVENYGTITAGSFAVYVSNGGTIVNGGSVTAGGNGNALTLDGGGTLTNLAGGILTAIQAGDAWGILARGDATTTIDNRGTINAGSGLVTNGNNTTMLNSGNVFGIVSGVLTYDGVTTSLTNSGTIASATGVGVDYTGGGAINNLAGGLIEVTGNGGAGVRSSGALILDNAGTIRTASGGAFDAITVFNGAAASITNSGTIAAATASGIALTGASTISNSGSITGGSDLSFGYGVQLAGGDSTLTNLSGGVIGGGAGSVLINGAGNMTIDLKAGSIANGRMLVLGGGAQSVTVAGSLNGVYDASAVAGVDTVRLASSGSLGGALLGAGADSLVINGGSLTGLADGGDDSDALLFDLAGNASFDAGNFIGFETRAKTGAGRLTLTGVDAMTIDFAVDGGTLALSGGSAINDGAAVSLASGATLQLDSSEAIRTLTGTGNVALGANTLALAGNDSATFDGVIGGTGNLLKAGTGTFTLTGANSYTGVTAVAGGTLALGASDVLADASTVDVASGAILDLGAFSDTVGSLALAGSVNGSGTLTAATYALNGGTVNANLGGGTLVQQGGTSLLNGTAAALTLSVNSGTLAIGAADRLADTAAVAVASGAALYLGAYSDTVGSLALAGGLNGSGTLTAATYALNGATVNANLGGGKLVQQSGTSLLNGTAAALSVLVNGGTLALGAADRLADTAAVVVASGATLNLGAFSDKVASFSLSGSLNGSGTLTAATYILSGATVNANLGGGTLVQQSDTSLLNGTAAASSVLVNGGALVLGAADRLADGATVAITAGGTLNLAGFNETIGALSGAGNVVLGAGRLTVNQSLNTLFSGAISGTGGLTKSGSGALNLSGNSTYSGATFVTGGLLSVNGWLASIVTASGGGRLGGNGTVGGLVVGAGGTLAPGNSIGTMNVAGNISFVAGSTYEVEIDPTSGDRSNATGNIAIAGGTVTVLASGTAYNPLTRYVILNAGGTVSGQFSGVTSNLAFLDASLEYSATQVRLAMRRNDIRFAAMATSPNQVGVANALQSLPIGGLYDQVLVQSATGAQQAFGALSGEIYASTPTALVAHSSHLRAAMLDARKQRVEGLELWGRADVGTGTFDADGSTGSAKLKTDSMNFAGGVQLAKNGFEAIIAGGYSLGDNGIDALSSRADTESWSFGGQVDYRTGGLRATVGAGRSWHDIETKRSIRFPGFAERTNSEQDGHTNQYYGELGYALIDTTAIELVPFASYAHLSTKVDGTIESGGSAGLEVERVSRSLGLGKVGLRFKSELTMASGASLKPRATLVWQQGMGDRGGSVTSSFAGSEIFTLKGAALDRHSVVFDGGVDVEVGGFTVGGGLNGSIGAKSESYGGNARLSLRF